MGVPRILFACLACVGHGRRVQTTLPQLGSSAPEEQEGGGNGMSAQEALLLALGPAIGGRLGMHSPPSLAHVEPASNSKIVQVPQNLHHSQPDGPAVLSLQPLARALLPVLVIFAMVWSSLPLTIKSCPQTNGRAAVPVMTAAEEDHPHASGTASKTSTVMNLAKNIVGSGVLALSYGIAAFTAAPIGLLPALVLLFCICGVSAYSFASIARLCNELGATTYRGVWARVFGENSAIIPAITVILQTFNGGLAYSIILGDSLASIASLGGLPMAFCKANTWILGLSGLVLLPLSLMRNLSRLAVGSIIGTAGTIYTALFMWLRLLDGSYMVGGRFHSLLEASSQPFFSAASLSSPLITPAIFVLVSMLSTTFQAHYNAPRFFLGLKTPADGSSKQSAFNKVVAGGFGLAAVLCSLIMAAGFLTFGGTSQGLILNSYATSDFLAFFARIGICTSIIFSYPIIFGGLREGVLDLLKLDSSKGNVHVMSTLVLISIISGLSLVIKNLGLVVAIGGAITGSALLYIYPAMMFIQATRMKRKASTDAGETLPAARVREMYANYGLAGLGSVLSLIGATMCLKSVGA